MSSATLMLCLAAAARPLSLDDALGLARENNHDLAAARAVLEQARAPVDRALAALLPLAAANGYYTHNYRNVTYRDLFSNLPSQFSSSFSSLSDITLLKGDALQGSLAATVPLVQPPAWFGLDAASKGQDAARSTFEVSQTQVLFSTAQGYFAAAGADELVVARDDAVAVAKVTLETAQARLNAGAVNRQEVTRAQLALINAQQAAREAQDTRASAYRAVATLTGLREPFHIEPAAAEGRPSRSEAELVDEALQRRPEMGVLRANIASASAQARAAAWQWSPTLSGFGAANVFNYAGTTGDKYSWNVGLQLSWTVYDGGLRDANRRLAEAQRAQSEAQLQQLHETIADAIADAVRSVDTQRIGLQTAVESVALAKDSIELLRTQYSAGTALQLDVLQAQDALVSAELSQVQARFGLALAELTLDRVTGAFPGR
jgi:outer membrane protein TolC